MTKRLPAAPQALNAVRAAGLKVLRVFLLSTEGEGTEAACPAQVCRAPPAKRKSKTGMRV